MNPRPPYLPAEFVRGVRTAIEANPSAYDGRLQGLGDQQRALVRAVAHEARIVPARAQAVADYLAHVVLFVFAEAKGSLRTARSSEIRRHSDLFLLRVPAVVRPDHRPFEARVRAPEHAATRAQPYLMDEILWALTEREPRPDYPPLPREEALRVYLVLWLASEIVNDCWTPPADFVGERTYTYRPP